jgi:hypothetical protein
VVSSVGGDLALAMLKRSVSVGDSVEVAGESAMVEDLPSKTQG